MALKQRNYENIALELLERACENSGTNAPTFRIYSGAFVDANNYVDIATYASQEILVLEHSVNWVMSGSYAQEVPELVISESSPDLGGEALSTGIASWFAIVDSEGECVLTGSISGQSGTGDAWVLDVNAVQGEFFLLTDFEFSVDYVRV